MASRMNMMRNLFLQATKSFKRPCTTVSLLLVSACAADDSGSKPNLPKQLNLLDRREMTHDALIRQACTLTANSSSQLLTQVSVAINDTSQRYRKAVADLMVLLEESILLITNASSDSLNEVEDLVVQQRSIVEEQRRLLMELVSLMDYVEKMVTSTAETAYLAGAEQASTLICERLNSALNKVEEECVANKKSEEELLKLQEAYVVKLAELYEREWKGKENGAVEETILELVDSARVTPIDVFEDVQMNEENSEEERGKNFFV